MTSMAVLAELCKSFGRPAERDKAVRCRVAPGWLRPEVGLNRPKFTTGYTSFDDFSQLILVSFNHSTENVAQLGIFKGARPKSKKNLKKKG